MPATEVYTQRHNPAFVAEMAARTADQEAAFFLPYLRPGMQVLDVGSGPGSITLGLAGVVAPGAVVGIEIEPAQVEQARAFAGERGVTGDGGRDEGRHRRVSGTPGRFLGGHVRRSHRLGERLRRGRAGLAPPLRAPAGSQPRGTKEKVRNLKRDGRVSVVAEAGTGGDIRGVTIQGRAEFLLSESAERRSLIDRLLTKYHPHLERRWGGRALPHDRVMFRIMPTRVTSWGLGASAH